MQLKVPFRWTASTESQSSSLMLKIMRSRRMPAQVTTMSMRPNWRTAVVMMFSAPAQLATESLLATASPPSRLISATTSKAGPVLGACPCTSTPKSLTTSLAPAAASANATPRPMPRPAPVTAATFPCNIVPTVWTPWVAGSRGLYVSAAGTSRQPSPSSGRTVRPALTSEIATVKFSRRRRVCARRGAVHCDCVPQGSWGGCNMMTKTFPFFAVLLLVAGVMLPPTHVAKAAGLSISPPTVAADYSGTIGLTITGLTTGPTVVVDKFLDLNSNGAVDGNDTLVQHFMVTDGQVSSIGGQRNTNVPGDEDLSVNGQVQTLVRFEAQSEANRAIAKFIYRVSTSGGLALASAPLTVTQLSFSQGVMGQVTSAGAPVPAAFVALLPPSGNGLTAATVSDANGRFTLNSAPGSYSLIALKNGLVFAASTVPSVTVNAGAFTTQGISSSAADRTISGRLTDASNGTGIPGVQVSASASSGNHGGAPATLLFTDSAGNFNIPVSTAATQGKLEVHGNDAALVG